MLLAKITENSLVTAQLTATISSYLMKLFLSSMQEGIKIGGQILTICVTKSNAIWWTTQLSLLAI